MSVKSGAEKAVAIIFGIWVLFAICLQTWGVISRNLLSWSTAWIDDIQRLNFIWLIWILAAVTYGSRGLIRLDLLQSKLVSSPRVYHLVSLGITLVELVFGASFLLLSSRILSTHLGSGETTVSIGIPVWLLTTGFVIGCLLLAIFALRNAGRDIRNLVANAPVDHESEIAQEVEEAIEQEASGSTEP